MRKKGQGKRAELGSDIGMYMYAWMCEEWMDERVKDKIVNQVPSWR